MKRRRAAREEVALALDQAFEQTWGREVPVDSRDDRREEIAAVTAERHDVEPDPELGHDLARAKRFGRILQHDRIRQRRHVNAFEWNPGEECSIIGVSLFGP